MRDQQPPPPPPSSSSSSSAADPPPFLTYTPAAAHAYARARGSYPAALYTAILERYLATRPDNADDDADNLLNHLLDVGCGPGNATRDLAPLFTRVTGLDPGAEMIAAARRIGGETGAGNAIAWEVAAAEEMAAVVGEGSVDLLTVAMAAHWFDMTRFWQQAARVVKPGGSVAVFTKSSYFFHPSTPHIDHVRRILADFEHTTLAPHELPGARLTRNFYRDLPLPWDVAEGDGGAAAEAFPRELFERHEWNVDGALDGGAGGDGDDDFFGGSRALSAAQMEHMVATTSTVQRWREAHPEAVGTEGDAVRVVRRRLEEVVGAGEVLRVGSGFALLFLRRR